MTISNITPVLIVKNSARTLARCLESLKSFTHVVIADNGSVDGSQEIARQFSNVSLFEIPFCGFGPLRNKAAAFAQTDWILSIDSDEFFPESNLSSLEVLPLDPQKVYSFSVFNFFNGKKMRGAGWRPKAKLRLYHRAHYSYGEQQMVHESLNASKNQGQWLSIPIHHTPYLSIDDFLRKMDLYSSLYVKENPHKKTSSILKAWLFAILRSGFTFFRSYILQMGFLDGTEGLFISLYNAHCNYYKSMKLLELK